MRPRKQRRVQFSPAARLYKPRGVPMRNLQVISLKDEEWEAILLSDYRGLSQLEASAAMGISRPTFSRVLSSARAALAKALVEGAALEIGGGDFRNLNDHKQPRPTEDHMKIAFSTTGNDLSSPMEERFGRSPNFLIYDTQTETFSVLANGTSDSPQAAGRRAAEIVVRAGAGIVVTGTCGPKAFAALKSAGVSVYLTDAATVQEALEGYQAGKLLNLGAA